uniref:Cytochrome b6-f complex subunit PetP n=1 Tax=Inkyuleea mariana TaxID=123988 RepID=A0A4D6WZY2_9FLOR|nr:cytochrome b6-f complex subunit PetP [Inkyuleea mariana]
MTKNLFKIKEINSKTNLKILNYLYRKGIIVGKKNFIINP